MGRVVIDLPQSIHSYSLASENGVEMIYHFQMGLSDASSFAIEEKAKLLYRDFVELESLNT